MLLRFFIACNIAFSVVDNVYFRDFLSHMFLSYDPPSKQQARPDVDMLCTTPVYSSQVAMIVISIVLDAAGSSTLSTTLLNGAALDADAALNAHLQTAEAITFSLDGWSTSRMHAIYAFIVILAGRRTFLVSLENLSIASHTGAYVAGMLFGHCCHFGESAAL